MFTAYVYVSSKFSDVQAPQLTIYTCKRIKLLILCILRIWGNLTQPIEIHSFLNKKSLTF